MAAGITTDWGDRMAVDVLTTLDAADLADEVWSNTIEAVQHTDSAIEAMVDRADSAHLERLIRDGFTDSGARGGSAWLAAGAIPAPPSLPDGYRLIRRSDAPPNSVHHFAERNGPDVERRLRETSLYRPELDIAVLDAAGAVASFGLFWWDPISRTGFVEPMGTAESHRRRGLARFVLVTGLRSLAASGATRIRINYDIDHEPSRSLYLDVGFEPAMETALFVTD